MISKCEGDEQCLYDAKAIGILEVGEMTKNNHRYYKFLDEAMKPGKVKKTIFEKKHSSFFIHFFICLSEFVRYYSNQGRHSANNNWKLSCWLTHDRHM